MVIFWFGTTRYVLERLLSRMYNLLMTVTKNELLTRNRTKGDRQYGGNNGEGDGDKIR